MDGSSTGLNTASMPADRDQANPRSVKFWYPNRFRRLYAKTLLPENLEKQELPADKMKSEIMLLIQEESKLQDLTVYTEGSVTKDQARWGFTAKQGATTMHEDSAA